MVKHIYKVEIDFFEINGKYNWKLWRKEKEDDESAWEILAFDSANSELEAYESAKYHMKRDFLDS
jgi:hypothetical protein